MMRGSESSAALRQAQADMLGNVGGVIEKEAARVNPANITPFEGADNLVTNQQTNIQLAENSAEVYDATAEGFKAQASRELYSGINS